MATTTAIRPAAVSAQGYGRPLDESCAFLGHRLTFNQLVVVGPRLALHALPLSAAAELRMRRRDEPSAQWSTVRSMRKAIPLGRRPRTISAVLTAEDGFVLGCLLLFFDDARFDSASRTAASILAGQLQSAFRRAEIRSDLGSPDWRQVDPHLDTAFAQELEPGWVQRIRRTAAHTGLARRQAATS
jgi:hypothetical protein